MSINCVMDTAIFHGKRGERVSIYRNIQNRCKEQNKTIIGLEEELQFPRGSICKWDKNRPSVMKVKAVADALHTTIDELLKEA